MTPPTPEKLAAIRAAAEAADKAAIHETGKWLDFLGEITPANVLALLDMLREAEARDAEHREEILWYEDQCDKKDAALATARRDGWIACQEAAIEIARGKQWPDGSRSWEWTVVNAKSPLVKHADRTVKAIAALTPPATEGERDE